MEDKKQTFYKVGWILFLIVIAFLIGIIFGIKYIDAARWPLGKSQTCGLFNITGENCDRYWCEEILDYSWYANDSVCVMVINNTIIVNNTINLTNYTSNATFYFGDCNETCIVEKAYNMSKNYTDVIVENRTIFLRDLIISRNGNDSYSNTYYSGNSSEPTELNWYVIGFIVFSIVCLIGFLSWTSTRKSTIEEDDTERSIKKPYKSEKKEVENAMDKNDPEYYKK